MFTTFINVQLSFDSLLYNIFPNLTFWNTPFCISPILNVNVFRQVHNPSWRKNSIIATYSMECCIFTANLSQRFICQQIGILGFIVNYDAFPHNNNMMISSMCCFDCNNDRELHIRKKVHCILHILK